ncbi:hypothetical protein MKW98_012950 [Papaver atlanticum]|uniref:Uncharacterized protein n=1 Tax=Papaver atlanticum TaxID=357466 RepID=A0AAD4XG78_9MAGN|nr:hypothetical protein MKW98_012950 [Papaver atlanticum]
MVFFDFNVPYLEPEKTEKPLPDSNGKKNTRLKIAVKAMELGYSGVAYNRCMKGVMSDNDRCTIYLFPLSSLLKASPTLSDSVKFHRELLKVPLNTPFRQYTRLTVTVENIVQAGVLNSGNPVLKTYDLVAVKPLNQTVFDHVCKVSEVDLIAIDFSERLPFRLKLPMVKVAIEVHSLSLFLIFFLMYDELESNSSYFEACTKICMVLFIIMQRGIYFEITYSHLISDIQARRQIVTNAKLLVDWTRGKNIIFTSDASSVNELRGPYDVANLSSLLGLSMERAKAATSKNCRALIARALRKQQFYKEAIGVEKIPSCQQVDTKEHWFADCNNWDEISSGEGDIQLDDIAKFFAASSKVPKTSKAIDFASVTKELPSCGMRLNDWLPAGGNKSQPQEDTPISDAKSDESPDMDKISKQPDGPEVVPFSHPKSLFSTHVERETSSTPILSTDGTQGETTSIFYEEPKSSDKVYEVLDAAEIVPHDTPSQDCISIIDVDLMLPDNVVSGLSSVRESGTSFSCQANPMGPGSIGSTLTPKDHVHTTIIEDLVFPMETSPGLSTHKESDSFPQIGNSEVLNSSDDAMGADAVNMEKVISEPEERKQIDLVSAGCDMPIVIGEPEEIQNNCDAKVLLADDKPVECHTNMQVDAALFADEVSQKDSFVEMERHAQEVVIEVSGTARDESTSGKGRVRRAAFPFPLHRVFRPIIFKKISKKSRNKSKRL